MYQAIPATPTTSYDISQSYSAADSPTPSSFLATTTLADPGGTTTVKDVALSTDLPIPSLVQITALSPATTSPQAVLPKLPYHPQLNVLYLVPLFIALGVVLGAMTAATMCKCRENRRRLLRTSSLLPGPPYVPPENDVEDRLLVHDHPSMEQVALFAATTPSKHTIHGSRYAPKRTFTWQTIDATRLPVSQPTYAHAIIPSSDGERFTVIAEEDPFLTTSPMVAGLALDSSNDVSVPQIRVSPSLQEPSPRSTSHQHHSDLPKPFRRSMFDILRLRGPYRQAQTARKDYTHTVPDEEPADTALASGVHRVSSLKSMRSGERQSHSVRLSLDGDFNIGDMEDALGLLNLQDEKQDLEDALVVSSRGGTLSSPEQSVTIEKPRKVAPDSKWTPNGVTNSVDEAEKVIHPDNYTKVPQRRHSRASQRRSTGGSGRFSAPDMHASVLPLSPPSLMSPPLEKSLFFMTSLSSTTSLANRRNTLAGAHSSPPQDEARSPEISLFPLPSKTKPTKKLRTKRPEPPLPYPSYPDLVHAQTSGSPDTKQRPVSPGSPKPKGRSLSAALPENATGIWTLGSLSQTSLAIALASSSSSPDVVSKVNDIVAQGYTKKRASMGTGGEDATARADSV